MNFWGLTNMPNLLLYTTQDKKVKVELYGLGKSVFLAQDTMAKFFLKKLRFDTSRENITMHIHNILKEGELQNYAKSTIKEIFYLLSLYV